MHIFRGLAVIIKRVFDLTFGPRRRSLSLLAQWAIMH